MKKSALECPILELETLEDLAVLEVEVVDTDTKFVTRTSGLV